MLRVSLSSLKAMELVVIHCLQDACLICRRFFQIWVQHIWMEDNICDDYTTNKGTLLSLKFI